MSLEKAIENAVSLNASDSEVIKHFLQNAPAREIQTFTHSIPVHREAHLVHWARTALDIRLAEDAANQAGRLEQQIGKLLEIAETQKRLAEKLEQQTARLINLTSALNTFTIVLIVLTVGLLLEGGLQFFESRKTATQLPIDIQQTNQAPGVTQHDKSTKN